MGIWSRTSVSRQSIASAASWSAPVSMNRRIARRSATSSAYPAASSASPSRPASFSLSLPRLDALSELIEVTASDSIGRTRAGSGDHGQPPSINWAVDPNTYTSAAAAQPVKSCLNLGPFYSADGARIVDAEAALRTARRACSTGRHPSCDPNINLTTSGDLARHTPLGMTWPKPFVDKGLGHSGTPCPMTKLTPNFS